MVLGTVLGAMHCDILDSFYLKPNGEVPCEDDIGEAITLGVVQGDGEWSPTEFFNNPKYAELKAAALRNALPWGETCRQCAHLQPRRWRSGLLKRRLRKLQIEPTMLCALRCPACGNREQLKIRKGARHMPRDLLERVLAGFRREGYRIDYVEWAGQGDPLLHPEFGAMSNLMRAYFPKTLQRIITNGNYDYRSALGAAYVEEIVVSCDGAIQANYERYRKRGDIEQVYRFMADVRRYSPRTKLIWKYVLFEFNDSDEEIRLAQSVANRIGAQEMRFVVTGTIHRSERFHLGNAHELPVAHPRVSVRLNPLMSRIDQMGTLSAVTPLERTRRWLTLAAKAIANPTGALRYGYDRVFTTTHDGQRFFVVEAWSLVLRSVARAAFELLLDGRPIAIQSSATIGNGPFDSLVGLAGLAVLRVRFSAKLDGPLPATIRIAIRQLGEPSADWTDRSFSMTPPLRTPF